MKMKTSVLVGLAAACLVLAALPASAETLREKVLGMVRAADVEADAAAARIEQAAVTATEYAQMPFAPAGIQETVELSGQSPVFAFPEGKARYAALEIPKLRVGSQLAMTQVDLGGAEVRGWRATVRPILILLDADFREVVRWAPETFEYDHSAMRHEGHKAVKRVDQDMVRAKYAVLLADPRAVGERHAMFLNPAAYPYMYESDRHFDLPFAHEGAVLLNFRAQVGFQQRRRMGR